MTLNLTDGSVNVTLSATLTSDQVACALAHYSIQDAHKLALDGMAQVFLYSGGKPLLDTWPAPTQFLVTNLVRYVIWMHGVHGCTWAGIPVHARTEVRHFSKWLSLA